VLTINASALADSLHNELSSIKFSYYEKYSSFAPSMNYSMNYNDKDDALRRYEGNQKKRNRD